MVITQKQLQRDRFEDMVIDTFFQERIWRQYGINICRGVTDAQLRIARIREFIIARDLANQVINPKARVGQPRETWQEAFERGYSQSLVL